MIGGTSDAYLIRYFWMHSRKTSSSKRGSATIVPPRCSHSSRISTMPRMWKNGATASTRPSGSPAETALAWVSCATRLRCVSITPLGSPLVPLEYGSATRSAAGSIATSGIGPSSASSAANGVVRCASPRQKTSRTAVPWIASCARSASAAIVSSHFAPVSRSWCRISSAVISGFIVVATPPAAATPRNAIAYSGRLGSRIAKASPLRRPRLTSPTAIRRMPSASCA